MNAGRILQVNAKPRTPGEHGLGKRPLPEAVVTATGVPGDYNHYRVTKKAGDPDMALLLMPAETLAQLRGEGWPVQPGHLGENLTTEGVPYAAFQPGTRWRAGACELQVSKACDPCDQLYTLPYVGDARGPAFLRAMLGRRGWYARVLAPGLVRPGDPLRPLG